MNFINLEWYWIVAILVGYVASVFALAYIAGEIGGYKWSERVGYTIGLPIVLFVKLLQMFADAFNSLKVFKNHLGKIRRNRLFLETFFVDWDAHNDLVEEKVHERMHDIAKSLNYGLEKRDHERRVDQGLVSEDTKRWVKSANRRYQRAYELAMGRGIFVYKNYRDYLSEEERQPTTLRRAS